MSNFPAWNPQPMNGYGQQMQPVYQQNPYQQAQPQQDAQLYCRMVTSEEEARATPVDFSGRPMIFPHLNAGWVYVKAFDAGSGSAVFGKFRRYEEPKQEPQAPADFAPRSEVQELREYVLQLEKKLLALSGKAETPAGGDAV